MRLGFLASLPIVLGLLLLIGLQQQTQSYARLLDAVGSGNVRMVTFRGDALEAELRDGTRLRTDNPERDYSALIPRLQQSGVLISAQSPRPVPIDLGALHRAPGISWMFLAWCVCGIYVWSWLSRREG